MAEQTVWKGTSEGAIDSVNRWMRSQPWYQDQLRAWGQRPDSVNLSKAQAKQLLKMAQANGVKVDEGHLEVDPAGNFNPKGHKLRNTLIAGAVGAGAAFGAPALAGLFSGAGAGAGAATGAASMATPALTAGIPSAAGLGGAIATPGIVSGIPSALAIGKGLPELAGAGAKAGGLLGKVGKASDIAGKLLPGLADMSKAGSEANMLKDNQRLNASGAQLNRDQFALQAPGVRMNQAMKASLLSNAAPSSVAWGGPGSGLRGEIPKYSGGLTGAMGSLASDTSPLAKTIQAKLLADQQANMDGNDPHLAKFGKTSAMDKVMGGATMGAGILSTLGPLLKRR